MQLHVGLMCHCSYVISQAWHGISHFCCIKRWYVCMVSGLRFVCARLHPIAGTTYRWTSCKSTIAMLYDVISVDCVGQLA